MAQPRYDNFFTPNNDDFYSHFTYPPLDQTRQEMRLLRIDLDGKERHQLISNVSLHRAPIYSALSYYAGNPHETKGVYVNGVLFRAFENLVKAIRRASDFWRKVFPGRELILWVDQICINQSDHTERAHQVTFMREIYRRAEQVIISLVEYLPLTVGQYGGLDPLAYNFDQWVNAGSPRPWLDRHFPPPRQIHKLWPAKRKPRDSDLTSLAIAWNYVHQILANPWWRRAWIYQEFILSSRAWFLVGTHHIAWTKLYDFLASCLEQLSSRYLEAARAVVSRPPDSPQLAVLQIFVDTSPQSGGHWIIVRDICESKKKWRGEERLSNLLAHARKCESSDSRDKVYAFIGLASPTYGITPDYSPSHTMDQILIEAARAIILTERRLDIMATATWNKRLPAGENALPSWVPDWLYHEDPAHAKFVANIGLPYDCKAAKDTDADVSFPVDALGITGRVLQAKGVLLGMISDIVKDDHRTNWRSYACKDSPILRDHTARFYLHVDAKSIAQAGDEVWIFYGADHPYVLRSDGLYRTLISQAMLRVQRIQPPGSSVSDPISSGPMSRILYGSLLDSQMVDPSLVCSTYVLIL